MAAAFCWNEASTAAMAAVVAVLVGLGVSLRISSKTTRWNMAASASRHTLCIRLTTSTGYFPRGGGRGGVVRGVNLYNTYLWLSPLTTLQSAPSITALATLLASARVGRGLYTMLSNIWYRGGYHANSRGRSQAFREANLCGHNDRLSCPVAMTDHHRLGQEHLLHRYLNAQVPSGHHDAITGSQDVIKVLHSFFIFNLVIIEIQTTT